MENEDKNHWILSFIFVVLFLVFGGVMQFICDYEIPDVEDIEIGN